MREKIKRITERKKWKKNVVTQIEYFAFYILHFSFSHFLTRYCAHHASSMSRLLVLILEGKDMF